jgi:hypothetical protein
VAHELVNIKTSRLKAGSERCAALVMIAGARIGRALAIELRAHGLFAARRAGCSHQSAQSAARWQAPA